MELSKEIANNYARDISFIVVSCDPYKDLWTPFFTCFFKYWPDCPLDIYLATNNEVFDDRRVKMINIGPDQDYSTNLISILSKIHTEWVIIWFEDAFISKTVNTAYVLLLIKQAIDSGASYLKLSADAPWVYTNDSTTLVAPVPKNVKYRAAFGMALYKKELLSRLLVPGESAWDLDKSPKSNKLDDYFFALTTNGLKNPPFHFQHAVVKRKWTYSTPAFLRSEGLGRFIPNRELQSFKEHIYVKIFLFRLRLFRLFRLYWYDKV
jgi:hypothetical protein